MRKYSTFDENECDQPRRSSLIAKLVLLMMVMLISPLLYECGNLSYSRWQGVVGRSQRVQTPILDAIAIHSNEFGQQFSGLGKSTFRKVEWKPSTIVPIAFGFAAVAGWFLRRGV